MIMINTDDDDDDDDNDDKDDQQADDKETDKQTKSFNWTNLISIHCIRIDHSFDC